MLNIDDSQPQIQAALKTHTQLITCYLNRKIFGKSISCSNTSCIICNSNIKKRVISQRLKSALHKMDISKLVTSKPQELLKLHKMFNQLYGGKSRKKISTDDIKSLKFIFNYSWFDDKSTNTFYNAYDLCNNLKIETCIYCNRLYISTIISQKKEKIIRPTLDHWFPQNKYPILALSFYNLIPSCTPCNSSIKHDKEFTLRKNIHPYIEKGITKDYKLLSTYDTSISRYKVSIKTKNKKVISTLEAMKVPEIYQHHQSELFELDLLRRKYNKDYLIKLGNLLDKKLSLKEVYRIMFGVEYEDQSFHKRPLSKLKKDLLEKKVTL